MVIVANPVKVVDVEQSFDTTEFLNNVSLFTSGAHNIVKAKIKIFRITVNIAPFFGDNALSKDAVFLHRAALACHTMLKYNYP